MAMSKDERLRRKKEAEKKRRQRIQSDPVRRAEENQKRRKRKALKKIKDKNKKESTKVVRARREKWRIAKQKQKEKKLKTLAHDGNLESRRAESVRRKAKKRTESKRIKQYYKLKKLEHKNVLLERKVAKYKMRLSRYREQVTKNSNSPNTVLKRELRNQENVSSKLKRRLLFSEALTKDLRDSLGRIRSTKEKNVITNHFRFRYVKKYRFLSVAKPFIPIDSLYRSSPKRVFGVKRKKMELISHEVRKFFEEDNVSYLSPSKGDQIVQKKVRKQKRFLSNSLQYLFMKFCEKTPFVISFSTFCKLRPFWIVRRKVNQRDTCLCVYCENAHLMCQQLRQLHIVNNTNIDALIEDELFCTPVQEACRFRKCDSCCHNQIVLLEFDGEAECFYDAWLTKTEIAPSNKREFRRTVKERIYCTQLELVNRFIENTLPCYVNHTARWLHQFNTCKDLKKKLANSNDVNQLVVHIDFAENYACKYAKEIQSVHFGANRAHVSLHTVMLYQGAEKKSFCTVSSDLRHDPIRIFLHLKPILQGYQQLTHIHFMSDSPSGQYRNAKMFYIMLKKIIPMFPNLRTLTWNYSEAGHGKGAPDGIGATLKRTCDRIVAENEDISNFDKFWDCVSKKMNKINVVPVYTTEDEEFDKDVTKSAIKVKGTMKVHMVKWTDTRGDCLYFNELSCFECRDQCVHHHITAVEYGNAHNESLPPKETEPAPIPPPKESEPAPTPDKKNWNVGDWLVAQFKYEKSKGSGKWIGQIERVNENDTFLVSFVRSKSTKIHSGYLYAFPNIPDTATIYKTQIVSSVPPPTRFQRLLKFQVNSSTLK